ncbi:unnamed protein product, partial [Effrenium voratum]
MRAEPDAVKGTMMVAVWKLAGHLEAEQRLLAAPSDKLLQDAASSGQLRLGTVGPGDMLYLPPCSLVSHRAHSQDVLGLRLGLLSPSLLPVFTACKNRFLELPGASGADCLSSAVSLIEAAVALQEQKLKAKAAKPDPEPEAQPPRRRRPSQPAAATCAVQKKEEEEKELAQAIELSMAEEEERQAARAAAAAEEEAVTKPAGAEANANAAQAAEIAPIAPAESPPLKEAVPAIPVPAQAETERKP